MQISMTNDRQHEWIAAAMLRARKKRSSHRVELHLKFDTADTLYALLVYAVDDCHALLPFLIAVRVFDTHDCADNRERVSQQDAEHV